MLRRWRFQYSFSFLLEFSNSEEEINDSDDLNSEGEEGKKKPRDKVSVYINSAQR